MHKIEDIQGTGLFSPFKDQRVVIQGVVTGRNHRGFFLQDPEQRTNSSASSAIFVYSKKPSFEPGYCLEVEGVVVDYQSSDFDHPVTQLHAKQIHRYKEDLVTIDPIWLSADLLKLSNEELAEFLNSHESMLMGLKAGATFIAPSNPFADYVVLPEPDSEELMRSSLGGVLVNPQNPEQWFPSFRLTNYKNAIRLDVGARLSSDVQGPLHYRAGSYQLAVNHPMTVEHGPLIELDTQGQLKGNDEAVTILTLNGFNLDVKIESPDLVDSWKDIDDDVGDGRFREFAKAIVEQANCPDIIALQEMQDSDGAEITSVVHATDTYQLLSDDISNLCGISYKWLDIAPEVGADGGQPGGNIRNGYLYNPDRVSYVEGSLQLIGKDHEAFAGCRKPLQASFTFGSELDAKCLTIINVHLSSKRHQHSIFAADNPGHDEREPIRHEQAKLIRGVLTEMIADDEDFYLTGDFNDCEFSTTLHELLADDCVNLIETLPKQERYDYNHRGKLLSLMHGVITKRQQQKGAAYEILHGNELQGVEVGEMGGKVSDHAYVIARLVCK